MPFLASSRSRGAVSAHSRDERKASIRSDSRPRLARRERGIKGQRAGLPHPRPGSARHIWRRSFGVLLNRRTPAAFDRRSPRGEPPSLDLHAMNRPSLSARRRVRQGSFAAPGRGIHVGSRARARGCKKRVSARFLPGVADGDLSREGWYAQVSDPHLVRRPRQVVCRPTFSLPNAVFAAYTFKRNLGVI